MLFRCTKAQELWQLTQCPSPSQGFTMVFEENMAFLFNSLDNQTPSGNSVHAIPCLLWNVGKQEFDPVCRDSGISVVLRK